MISTKTYVCGLCKTESQHSTNHSGEIYTPCKNCGNGVLYCKDNELTQGIETEITLYRFDISNQQEKTAYINLKKELKEKGMKLFDCINSQKWNYFDLLREHKTVFLNTESIFNNQWVSNVGRLHDWFESIYPNRKIKEGYYLSLTDTHNKLREPKKYNVKTWYKGELIGVDVFDGINTADPSNKAYNKYVPTIENFDIWSYKNEIQLI